MLLRIALICALPVLMLAGRVDAATVTRTVTFTPTSPSGGFVGSFEKFDPTLGEFIDATLDFTLVYSGPPSRFNIEVNALMGGMAATFSDTRTVIRGSRWPFLMTSGTTSQTFAGRATVDTRQATGSGLGAVNIFAFSPGTLEALDGSSFLLADFVSLSGTVDYTYTPAPVPGPAALALLAPAVMSLALFRRRAANGARQPGLAA